MSLLKIPQGWKPKNQPADPRGYYDPRIYLPRMAAKLRQTPEPTAEEDEAFRELERTARNALFAICDEAKNIGIVGTCDGVDLPQFVPLSDYEKVVQVLLESSPPPKHAIFVSNLMMRYQK